MRRQWWLSYVREAPSSELQYRPKNAAVHSYRIAALLVAGLLPACSARAAPVKPDALTPAQRTQVVQIVRDAMKNDPSILREAILALQADNARVEARQIARQSRGGARRSSTHATRAPETLAEAW